MKTEKKGITMILKYHWFTNMYKSNRAYVELNRDLILYYNYSL